MSLVNNNFPTGGISSFPEMSDSQSVSRSGLKGNELTPTDFLKMRKNDPNWGDATNIAKVNSSIAQINSMPLDSENIRSVLICAHEKLEELKSSNEKNGSSVEILSHSESGSEIASDEESLSPLSRTPSDGEIEEVGGESFKKLDLKSEDIMKSLDEMKGKDKCFRKEGVQEKPTGKLMKMILGKNQQTNSGYFNKYLDSAIEIFKKNKDDELAFQLAFRDVSSTDPKGCLAFKEATNIAFDMPSAGEISARNALVNVLDDSKFWADFQAAKGGYYELFKNNLTLSGIFAENAMQILRDGERNEFMGIQKPDGALVPIKFVERAKEGEQATHDWFDEIMGTIKESYQGDEVLQKQAIRSLFCLNHLQSPIMNVFTNALGKDGEKIENLLFVGGEACKKGYKSDVIILNSDGSVSERAVAVYSGSKEAKIQPQAVGLPPSANVQKMQNKAALYGDIMIRSSYQGPEIDSDRGPQSVSEVTHLNAAFTGLN